MPQSTPQGALGNTGAKRTVLNNDMIQIGGNFTAPTSSNIEANPSRLGQDPSSTLDVEDLSNSFDRPSFGQAVKSSEQQSADSLKDISDQQRDKTKNERNSRLAFAGAKLFLDVMNAKSQYDAVDGQSKLNIYQANISASDAISRGAGRALERKQEGKREGQSALVALAAQGIDVDSSGAQRVVASQEAVGIYNGMLEEINASREALGFELQKVQFGFQRDQAKIQRDTAIIGSSLEFGATAASTFF